MTMKYTNHRSRLHPRNMRNPITYGWHFDDQGGQGGGQGAPTHGGNQGNQGNQAPTGNPQTDPNAPPSGNNTPPTLNPWAKPQYNQPSQGGNNGNPADAPPGGNTPSSGAAQPSFQDYVKSLPLMEGVDLQSIVDQDGNVNMETFQGAISQGLQNTFSQAMLAVNKLLDKRLESAIAEATNKATTTVNTSQGMQNLLSQIPTMAQPENRPIAEATLAGFMRQNNGDVAKSVADSVAYFKQMASVLGTSLDVPAQNPGNNQYGYGNPPTQANMRGGNQPAGNEPDWMQLLAGDQGEA